MSVFDCAILGCGSIFCNKHHYSLAIMKDGKSIYCKNYQSRQAAVSEMYKFIDNHDLGITKIWDDKHDKTYFCNDGYEFHINRDC